MATYLELMTLQGDGDLLNRVIVAVAIAADTIRLESAGTTNHANRMIWAEKAFSSPIVVGKSAYSAVLAANKDATVTQIQGATDAAIQTNVDAVVDVLAGE